MTKKVAVIYFSKTGNTQELAEAIGRGAESAGAAVDIFLTDEWKNKNLKKYQAFAFGGPADGDEQVQKSIARIFAEAKADLGDRKVILFGSWGWGNGVFLENWKKDALAAGVNVIDTVACKKFPEDADVQRAEEAGKGLAK